MSSNQTNDQQNQTDIDQILNEVEELRKELSTEAQTVDTHAVAKEIVEHLSSAPAPTPTASATPAPASTPTLAQATEVAKELAAIAEAAKVLDLPSSDDDLMNEFNASLDHEAPIAHEAPIEHEAEHDPEDSMESTLADLKDDPSVKTLLDQTFDDQARRQNETQNGSMMKEQSVMNNSSDSSNSIDESSPSLTMSLTGSMTLRLKYEFAGQEVTVGFTDEYLKVELADGTEFKIPVGRQKALRRAA